MHVNKSGRDILRDLKGFIEELVEVEKITARETATELARFYVETRDFYEELHNVSKELTKLKDLMSYKDVPEAFEREGTTTLTLRDGYRVTISALVRASTKDMDTGIEWCKQCVCGHKEDEHKDWEPWGCSAQIRIINSRGNNALEACPCSGYDAPNAGLVKETINAQTLAAFARAEMEIGRELPPDVFTVHIGQNTSVTKVK